jgi:ACS family glucarate transporter-like MFS transporter
MLPTFGGFLGMITGGTISDWLLRNGYGARMARARFPGLCTGLAMPLLLGAVLAPSTALSILLFVLFYFVFSLSVSGFWSMPLELAPRAVGAVGGVMNTMGNFAGVFGPTVAGFMVQYTGSWVALFYLAAGCGVLSCAVFALLVNTDPISISGVETAGEGDQGEARMGIGH